jgi:hypothetical protein
MNIGGSKHVQHFIVFFSQDSDTEGQEVPEKVSRLAINMEGGFSTTATQEWDQTKRIVVWPGMEAFDLTDPLLPLQVTAWEPSSENRAASVGCSAVEPELFALAEPEPEVIPDPTLNGMTLVKNIYKLLYDNLWATMLLLTLYRQDLYKFFFI